MKSSSSPPWGAFGSMITAPAWCDWFSGQPRKGCTDHYGALVFVPKGGCRLALSPARVRSIPESAQGWVGSST
ncbi:hypothetical protein Tco_0070577, partial [Tanacetum coccineum]